MSRITIPFYYCKSRVPLIFFKTSDKEKHIGILDTGSEICLFDESLVENGMQSIENDKETNLVGVNGDSKPRIITLISGEIGFKTKDGETYNVTASGTIHDFDGLSSVFSNRTKKDMRISAIFGSDFFKEYNAKIDYKNKTLTLDC